MNRHSSMNRAYRLIWSVVRGIWIPVGEKTSASSKRTRRMLLAAAMSLGADVALAGGPSGGQVTAGTGSIAQSGAVTIITQDSPKLSLTWTSFNIAPQQTVDFVQPSASAIAVNRIFDTNGSQILGHLNANGQVFLINPNGILFGPGAEVNVGGLVASTLELNQASVDGDTRLLSGNSAASVVNEGTITATPGGFVALLANRVDNRGVISAQLGTVALAAGSAATLTFSDNSLRHVQVDQSVLRSVANNGGLIRADGGQVVMTAGARDALLASVVNNTGVIEARTVSTHDGKITLLAGMAAGTVDVGGTIDASAPDGGNGGLIETSAARVEVATNARVTTAAAQGFDGSWLIDPQDFTVAASGGDITGAGLSNELASTPVLIESSAGNTAGSGNINVSDAVAWGANTVLTLTASNNVNINANITATGTSAGLVLDPATANGGNAANVNGVYALHNGASITLSGATPTLTIAGHAYTVINTLGAAGSTTGTDLQGINGRLAAYYALGSNIDATPTLGWNAGAGFMPIGTAGLPFTGTFDGLGHMISNLTINRTTPNVGLFGDTGAGAAILSVGLVGDSVTGGAATGALIGNNGPGVAISDSYTTGSVSGAAGTGGLVGTNTTGPISESYSTGNVSGAASTGGLVGSNTTGAISESYSTGNVGGAAGTGGLIGSSTSGTVSKSYASGNVNGAAGSGGLIGSNTSGAISDSYATGNVNGGNGAGVGGLIGSNTSGTVTNTYAAGGVSGTGASVGALIGSSNPGVVIDSYWDKTTSLVQSSAGGGIGMTSAQMMTQANFASATIANSPDNPSWDFAGTWVMYEGHTDPLLSAFMSVLTVTANDTNKIYGQASPAFGVSFSATPNGNLLGTVVYSGSAQTATNVGSYVIAPSGLYSNQGGYIIGYANGTLTVTPATLTVTANGASRLYGQANPVLTGTVTGFVGTDTLLNATSGTEEFATAASPASNVGNYAISASGLSANNGNYLFSYAAGNATAFQITPATLTVTANGASRLYGQANPALTGSVTGFVGTDTLLNATSGTEEFATAATPASNVGNYAISASGLSANNGNYLFSYAAGNATAFQITPATLTVTANGASRLYGQANPALTGSVTGFVGTDTLLNATSGTEEFATAATPASNVGNYAISASGLSANNGNYLFSYAAGNATAFQITPATLTYNAAASSVSAGQTPTGLSGTLSGFVLTDGQANATAGTLIWSTDASASSTPGHYTIDGGGLTATNYVFVEAAANATALTVQAGSPPVVPPGVASIVPSVVPPVVLPVIVAGSPPVSGADAATHGPNQTVTGTPQADPPASQTTSTFPLTGLAPDSAQGAGADAELGASFAVAASDGVMMDKRVVTDAMIPSLRIVRGGVRLPDNVVDVNGR